MAEPHHDPLADPIGHSLDQDIMHLPGGVNIDLHEALGGLTKMMLLELVAAVAVVLCFTYLASNLRRHGYAKGTFANFLDAMVVFIRDNVAVPAIGEHDARRFLPFLWSLFFFILFNNLLGMVPWLGSPTGNLGCTVALALCSFLVIHGSGVAKLGLAGYAEAFVPPVPLFIWPIMLVLELIGHLVRPTILAFRLFVNMLAGHTVLFVLLAFIAVVGPRATEDPVSLTYLIVTPASLFGVVALSFLELFVAFLQAYIFVFLSALFIGAAVHPHH